MPAVWRQDFCYEHPVEHPAMPKSEEVVRKRYKYLRYYDQFPVHEDLYAHPSDPDKINNLSDNPKYEKVLEQLRLRGNELKNEYWD